MERISRSAYQNKFILKGGMLVAAMVGLNARSTMDMDATIKGANVNVEDVENMMAEIISVPIDDGVTFQVKSISEIMDEAEYPGIRVTMTALFDGVRTPLKLDISTGDAITPGRYGTVSSSCWRIALLMFGLITWRLYWQKNWKPSSPGLRPTPA